MNYWLELGLAALGGGAIAKAFEYLIVREKSDDQALDRAVELIMADNARLRKEVAELVAKHEKTRAEMEKVRQEHLALQLKYTELDARFRALSEEYEKLKHNE